MKSGFTSGRELTPSELEFHVGELTEQGYTIIPDAVDAEYLAPAVEAAEDIYQRESEIALRLGTSSVHCWSAHCIVGKHPFFETFYLNPPVLSVCREYLGEDMVLYDATARSIRPSEGREPGRGFQIHADRAPFSIVPFEGGKHYPMAINVAWPVVDFTAENGATLVWPGTHKSCEIPDPDADYPGSHQAVVPAGTAIVWDAAVWHASGINRSDHVRHSILAFFQRWWVKGMIDNTRVIPQGVQDRLLPEMRKLLGLGETIPEYTEVRALSPEQIKRLTPWEKDVLGIGTY